MPFGGTSEAQNLRPQAESGGGVIGGGGDPYPRTLPFPTLGLLPQISARQTGTRLTYPGGMEG